MPAFNGEVHGWFPPQRAPELRRMATRLEAAAARSEHPDRVRRLARECRLRAVRVELGPHAQDELAELADTFEVMRTIPHPTVPA